MFNYDTLIQNIPQQLPLLGREKYFHAVVFVPFMLIENTYHLLFQTRASNIRQGDEISFPGGGYDASLDKSIIDTAIRETCEELGINNNSISCDATLGTIVAPMGTVVDIIVGTIQCPISSFHINKSEVAKVFSIPINYFIETVPEKYPVQLYVHPSPIENNNNQSADFPAQQLGLPKRYHQAWGGSKHDIYVYKTNFGIIWGLTAQIIQELLLKIK